ncbi:hypothetical protein HAX54_029302 [Datura stramonium]|uniref:Uncharacterized protein n=1 Tax=Datura stramonium TaxID=4076 RepID=A0ABS8V7Y7_DATST|nr:hypothetical protein [Datura stramonium]
MGKDNMATRKQMFTLSTLEDCECVDKRGGIGVQSTIFNMIEAQQHGIEEIDQLTVLLAQKDVDLVLLKAEQATQGTGGEPSAIMEIQNENAQLKTQNTWKKWLEDLTQQMLHD